MPISAPPPSWASIKNKPTTMAGFGITDEKCRAWVNFNGTGTVAIRASGNVSSITDNGEGDYTVNFTTAMPDANYAAAISIQTQVGGVAIANAASAAAPTASTIRVVSFSTAGVLLDAPYCFVAIFR